MRLILFIFLVISSAFGAPLKEWGMVEEGSSLRFMAIQNGSKVLGQFKKFHVSALFSPENLKESSVKVEVEINSITTETKNIADTLKSPEWFDAAGHPKAIFKSRKIEKAPNSANKFMAEGLLTIKNVSMPIVLDFTFSQAGGDAEISGTASLNRTDFKIGWDNTSVVAGEVLLFFEIIAK